MSFDANDPGTAADGIRRGIPIGDHDQYGDAAPSPAGAAGGEGA